jgi:hypothetical protein
MGTEVEDNAKGYGLWVMGLWFMGYGFIGYSKF